jgi:hypothetical protein
MIARIAFDFNVMEAISGKLEGPLAAGRAGGALWITGGRRVGLGRQKKPKGLAVVA